MKEVFAARLKQARLLAKLSLRELAERMNNAVSYVAIKKYEDAKSLPDESVIVALANALSVKPDYFFKASAVELTNVEFRRKAKLGVKEINSIKEIVKDHLERYFEVEEILQIERSFQNPLAKNAITKPEEVEDRVLALLKSWHLGYNPIPNVIETLEEKGIKVIEIEAPNEFDGLSTYVNGVPVIVLNKNYGSERKRFTALHELAHLLLLFPENTEHRIVEKCCHRFASAMLIPRPVMYELLGKVRVHITLAELIMIKEQYGISVQAIMHRANDLNIVNDYIYKGFCIRMAKNKKEEGLGKYLGVEKSYRFRQLVYRIAVEELVSLTKAANLGDLKAAELRDIIDAQI
ncbi:helix-turn-helix domain protein (plasmid) [Fibrisoma limi BUZ 3]|uniref:Helix-turn-helix domain protein n=1 Tax=Fibrisoma limi BUZ 3 TaxID=1185876 RepID=I2GU29_9BACT|nr:XRE family transcriptional regulator [Fibrisoma limi]CCH57630.1 helix-turn-helix domain protein [Fibrisoma limi BUZ 3]